MLDINYLLTYNIPSLCVDYSSVTDTPGNNRRVLKWAGVQYNSRIIETGSTARLEDNMYTVFPFCTFIITVVVVVLFHVRTVCRYYIHVHVRVDNSAPKTYTQS